MKKILVAGGTGFVGYHIAKAALKKKFKVFSVSKNPPNNKRFLKKVNYIFLDLSKNKVKIPRIKSFEYIVNCAGYGKHLRFNKIGKQLYLDHINITKNLTRHLNSNRSKIKKFIQLGSSLEYSKKDDVLTERDKCIPDSIYGKAKLDCNKYLMKLNKKKKNFFPLTIFRIFQLYGPNQDDNRLIPFVIANCKKNKKFYLTLGNQIRDFCYIDDFITVLLKSLTKKDSNGEIINIGYGKFYEVKYVVNLIRSIIGKGKPIFGLKKLHVGEKKKIIPNINKLKKMFGWKPKYSLEKGLIKTINS